MIDKKDAIARSLRGAATMGTDEKAHLTKEEKEALLRKAATPEQIHAMESAREEFIRIWEEDVIPERGEDARRLLRYLDGKSCDFFVAPASAKGHGAVLGGLVRHSLNVYDCLIDILDGELYRSLGVCPSPATIAIVALLHDMCKANFYTVELRNRKTGKKGANGKDEWESYPFITYDDSFPYGHGEKSAYMAERFMHLTPEEAMAIRHHMGFSDLSEQPRRQHYSDTVRKYPLVLAVTEADGRAALLVEGYAATKAILGGE